MNNENKSELEILKGYYEPDNSKRPFGNSDIEMNIAEILNWNLFEDSDGELHLSKYQFNKARESHKQIVDELGGEIYYWNE